MGIIQKLAQKAGINTAQELSYSARITRPTAYKFWMDDFANTQFSSVLKVKGALGVTLSEMEAAISREAEATE